jgi:acetyl-CoA carboxylase carboxyl transferase subunit beta
MLEFIRKLFNREEKQETNIDVPENTFVQCPTCKATLYQNAVDKEFGACPDCGYLFPLSTAKWIALLTDEGSFTELFRSLQSEDPLEFPGYTNRLEELGKTHPSEAIVVGTCRIGERSVGLGVMDNTFLMASMGSVVGEKITKLIERCTERKMPVVLVVRSGGARMQEGVLSLMQMAKTSAALRRHHNEGQLFIPILTHPTTGGVSASFAMLGDIILAEPHALIGFAGPRVIEQTIKQKLPEGFQSAEFLLEKGFVDAVVPRKEIRSTLQFLLQFHAS